MQDDMNSLPEMQLYRVERQRSTGVTKTRAQLYMDALVKQIALERVQEIKDDYDLGDYGLGDYFTSLILNDPIARLKIEAAQAGENTPDSQPSYLRTVPLTGRRPHDIDPIPGD